MSAGERVQMGAGASKVPSSSSSSRILPRTCSSSDPGDARLWCVVCRLGVSWVAGRVSRVVCRVWKGVHKAMDSVGRCAAK